MNKKKMNQFDKDMASIEQMDYSQPNIIEVVSSTSLFKYFLGGMIVFGICFVSCLFVFQILLTQIGVIGYSMQPSINASAYGEDGELNTDSVYYIKDNKYSYKDIVIINGGKTDSGDKIIKRVIATPGQTITFKSAREVYDANPYFQVEVYVNNIKLNETYVKPEIMILKYAFLESKNYQYYNTLIQSLRTNKEFSHTLGKDEYFIMGDNRNNSTDSRFFGPVKKSDILGKVVIQIKPGENLFESLLRALIGCHKIYC